MNRSIKIPAVLWGEKRGKLLIEVHGNLSDKEDTVISIAAEKALGKGYQVLSFDLPQHGERVSENYSFTPWNCISDLSAVYEYAVSLADDISLFACSIGAYFSLLAYHEKPLRKSLFLSPVVNMERLIQNMMKSFNVTEERLYQEKQIPLPIGQTMDWDYYSYVKKNPVCFPWEIPTAILYGSDDNISEWEEISGFAAKYSSEVRVFDRGEHFFHTDEQLDFFKTWLDDILI